MERGYRVNGETFCECIGDIFCRSSGARLGHVTTEAHADLLVPHPWHYLMSLDVVEREYHDWGSSRDFDKWTVPWGKKRPQLAWRGSQAKVERYGTVLYADFSAKSANFIGLVLRCIEAKFFK